jgi:AcrR family transcriptional regulator
VVRENVLRATLEAVAQHGVDGVTVSGIARDAGVHDTTIYRRWASVEHLVVDALLAYSEQQLPLPDTGSVRNDLIEFAQSVASYVAAPPGRTLVRSMVTVDDPRFDEQRATFWQGRYNHARTMVDRARTRGELTRAISPEMLLEMLIAPIHFRALLTHQPTDRAFITTLVDALLGGSES